MKVIKCEQKKKTIEPGMQREVVATSAIEAKEVIATEKPWLGPLLLDDVSSPESIHGNPRSWAWHLTDAFFKHYPIKTERESKIQWFQTYFYSSREGILSWCQEDEVKAQQWIQLDPLLNMEQIKDIYDRIATNYLQITLQYQPPAFSGVLFTKFCMINHACDPNAQLMDAYDSKQNYTHSYLVARRSIAKNEPITISYIGPIIALLPEDKSKVVKMVRYHELMYFPRKERLAMLKENYGFVCNCANCQVIE